MALFRLFTTLIAGLFFAAVQFANAQTYRLMSAMPYHSTDAIRVLITGSPATLVEKQTRARLSLDCANAASTSGVDMLFTSGDRRPSQDPNTWNVQFIDPYAVVKNSANFGTNMFVCFSTNGGATYAALPNEQGRTAFFVWTDVPTATLSRLPPRQGSAVTITLIPSDTFPLGFNGIPAPSQGNYMMRVVTDPNNCFSANPTAVGGGSSASISSTGTFTLTLSAAASNAYVCLSVNGGTVWSLIPYNDYENSVADVRGYTTRGVEPVDFSFPILSNTENRFTLSCTPSPPVAGVAAVCDIGMVNSGGSAVVATASDLQVLSLTDGGGVPVCPLPVLSQNGNYAQFTFMPNRHGREGFLKIKQISGSGAVLEAEDQQSITDYYAYQYALNTPANIVVPSTQRVLTPAMRDYRKSHFPVLPSPLDIFPFSNANLLVLSTFTNYNLFAPSIGVKWYQPRVAPDPVYEPPAVTLPNTTTTQTMSKDVSVPAGAERCRAAVKYFFTAENGLGLTTNAFIGSIRVSTLTAGGVATVVKEFSLYSYLRYVVVVGGGNTEPGALDGYIRTEEQLVTEISIIPNLVSSIRIELTIDHSMNKNLYFIDPQLTCAIANAASDANKAAATDTNDVAALQAILTTYGGTMGNWRDAAGNLNGDPCRNHWQGIICRRNRIVELHLRYQGLAGVFPTFTGQQLSELEVVDVRDNAITGTWNLGAGLTKLRDVRIANNQIVSVLKPSTTAFSHENLQCLAYFDASNNLIDAFPSTGITDSSVLQVVDLSVNVMANSLPTSLSAMINLKLLNLNRNALTGSLPTQLPTQSLRSFDVSRNAFTGAIPATYTNFRNLLLFDVSHNQLSGKMSVVPMATVRTGHESIFRAGFNFFTYLPGRHGFRREGQMGNFFQCPLIEQREDVWLPYASTYEGPMKCDWQVTTEE